MANKKVKVRISKKATWEICCDGWYPYCSACYSEPDWKSTMENGLPKKCPKCNATMTNTDELNHTSN